MSDDGKRLTVRDEMAIRAALAYLPKTCRYHGDKIVGRDIWRFSGGCCGTGEPAMVRRRTEEVLDHLSAAALGEPLQLDEGQK